MQNVVFLIGRLVSDPELKQTETSKNYSTVVIAVPRSFKNSEGLYETDFIRCNLWNGIANNVTEYCKKGDLVGVKGRIQIRSYIENEDTKFITEIIADKVSFLSSKKADE